MALRISERYENYRDGLSTETIGDAKRIEECGEKNSVEDEFDSKIMKVQESLRDKKTIIGKKNTEGKLIFNTKKTLEELKKNMSRDEKEEFDIQIDAGGGVEGQRGRLRGAGREYYFTSDLTHRASGRFVTDIHPGNTAEERKENLQLPKSNGAQVLERVKAAKAHIAFVSKVSPQEDFAKESGYVAREGIEQVFIPRKDKRGPVREGLFQVISKENNDEDNKNS